MIETSVPKVKIRWEDGAFYCPYIPDITLNSNYKPVEKIGFKARKKEVEE
jgi:hypothetical protein